jgi:hypothetical protein
MDPAKKAAKKAANAKATQQSAALFGSWTVRKKCVS